MKPIQILSKNITQIFKTAGINASRMSELCCAAGLTDSASSMKTTFSRILNGEANIRMDSLEIIYTGISRLPGFENIKISDLFDENFVAPRASITTEQLERYIQQLFSDLKDMEWIEVNTDPAVIQSVALLLAKKQGFEVISKSKLQTIL